MQLSVEDFGRLGVGEWEPLWPLSIPPEGSTSMTLGLWAAPSAENEKADSTVTHSESWSPLGSEEAGIPGGRASTWEIPGLFYF